MPKLAAIAILALLTSACATAPSQEQIDALLMGSVATAQARFDQGDKPEAAVLLHSIQRVDPEYPGVPELATKLGPDGDSLHNRGWLGINRRLRAQEDSPFLTRLLFYLPDRAFDLLDLVTFNVHIGFGAYANVHATRAAQLGGGLRSKFGVGLHDQRSIGIASEAEVGVAALAFGSQSFSGSSVGVPGGVAAGGEAMLGAHRPSQSLYQDYRDYWAVGASATVLFVGAEFDFHPMQIFDFIGGVFLLDFARDDMATTRGLRFSSLEFEAIRSLNELGEARIWEGMGEDEEAPAAAPDAEVEAEPEADAPEAAPPEAAPEAPEA
ncbi:MAG: hypothetical protein JRG76_17275 [Deltaproteobacteria bacterium]|nr:hypothetical protein [Deltaproteobacteria bacterium]MBW2416253.1 hypothetical protein [Deltaproteobacteria bacterium]